MYGFCIPKRGSTMPPPLSKQMLINNSRRYGVHYLSDVKATTFQPSSATYRLNFTVPLYHALVNREEPVTFTQPNLIQSYPERVGGIWPGEILECSPRQLFVRHSTRYSRVSSFPSLKHIKTVVNARPNRFALLERRSST